jgi:NhaA family Na+:H+ antiporter
MLNSGVHATITGVLLAFAIPFAGGHKQAPSYKLEHLLHKPVAFFILPIFAIANTAITLNGDIQAILFQNINSIGIILGLVIGKPLGILLFSYISYIIGISKLPEGIKWKNILGVGFLAGIGFTMSIFITLLAFEDIQIINNSKIAIIFASTLSGIIGYLFLRYTLKSSTN